jgi:hypothetical protein
MTSAVTGRWNPRGLLGLYLVIAYCIAVIIPLPLILLPREELRIGPFVLEGNQAITATAGIVVVWAVMIWGLIRRRPWGRVFALFVFGGHGLLLVVRALTQLSAWHHLIESGVLHRASATPTVMLRMMAWPTLCLFVASAFAFVYVAKRRDLFSDHSLETPAVA